MDSMRSLNKSLPGTSPPKQPAEAPEALLTAFRAAALQVTNLYKTASSGQGRARAEGYQDALDELLAFMDKEDIGLSDGEGWRIRRWATERLDGRDSAPQNGESDEEISEKVDRASSRSPVLSRSQPAPRPQSIPRSVRTASPEQQTEPSVPVHDIPPPIEEEDEISAPEIAPLPQTSFTFRSQHAYPQDAEMIVSDLDTTERPQPHRTPSAGSHATNPRLTNQSSRTNSRRLNTRTTSSIGRGAGQKRKVNFSDFSDFFGIDLGKDRFGGGGKRGRFT